MLLGYRALDERSQGMYGEFLRLGARCTKCQSDPAIPAHKQPVPLLSGGSLVSHPLECAAVRLQEAHAALEAHRRRDGGARGSLSVDASNPRALAQLGRFLDSVGLAGLSIGHCGWSDLTMRVRGREIREGVKLLILGADWYPLAQCSNFLLDRYEAGVATFGRFLQRLTEAKRLPSEDAIEAFFREHRVYLGNTLLCYRSGWETTGDRNLSPQSFRNCREHLVRHVQAVAPKVIVTFGRNSCASVASLLKGSTPAEERALEALRGERSLGAVMEELYGVMGKARGIRGQFGDREIAYVRTHPPGRTRA